MQTLWHCASTDVNEKFLRCLSSIRNCDMGVISKCLISKLVRMRYSQNAPSLFVCHVGGEQMHNSTTHKEYPKIVLNAQCEACLHLRIINY